MKFIKFEDIKMSGGTCCTCGKKISYGSMYCESCRPK